jgi:(2R)-3-sulfolactate dehydrogenase (NADP+)
VSTTTIAPAELEKLITAALTASNTTPENAASVARALTQAEIDGQKGHGISRVASYAAQAKSGKVDGHATPTAHQTRTASVMIDAKNGFAYPAIDLAIAELPELAGHAGIAAAGLTRSHHGGVMGRHCERLAEKGLIALAFSNTPHAMTSWGGRKPVFGTNPIAFAAPLEDRPPVVVDLALSQVARGKIMTAAQKGEPIPAGWAFDEHGQPATDAKAALKGTLVPLGGAKGSALAMMVEILAAGLTGACFASEASSFFDADGPPPGVGQLILTIDPGAFAGRDAFAERFADLAGMIETDAGARLPGQRRVTLRETARRTGIAVDAKTLAEIVQLG